MPAIAVSLTSWDTDKTSIQAVRVPVFVKEQHVAIEVDFDGLDQQAVHWLVRDLSGKPIATARLLADGHFGRMAVLKAYRQQGIGRMVMHAAIQYAREQAYQRLFLHAQLSAVAFYERLGFIRYGDEFMDANIAHIAMRLILRS